jgi:hypothetical protein
MRAVEYRIIYEEIPNSFKIHSEFIAPSFNEATNNDLAGYRNHGGAWESAPKGKEGTSKRSLSGEAGELGSHNWTVTVRDIDRKDNPTREGG